jgi:hypothetical protein
MQYSSKLVAIIFHCFIALIVAGTSSLAARIVLKPGATVEWVVPYSISNIQFIYLGKEGETIFSRKITVLEGEKFILKTGD